VPSAVRHPFEVATETLCPGSQRAAARAVDRPCRGSAPVMMRGGAHSREWGMTDGFVAVYGFLPAAIAGHVVSARVPVILHTPLLSGSNFIRGIVLIGGIAVLAHADTPLEKAIGFAAVLMG